MLNGIRIKAEDAQKNEFIENVQSYLILEMAKKIRIALYSRSTAEALLEHPWSTNRV